MPEYKVLLSLPQEDKPNKVELISNGTTQFTILGKIKVRWVHSITYNVTIIFFFSPPRHAKTKKQTNKQTNKKSWFNCFCLGLFVPFVIIKDAFKFLDHFF